MGELIQYKNMYYQWVKGDYTGRIEEFESFQDENNLNFIVFKSGKRINESLLLEYLIEIPEYQVKIAEESVFESLTPNTVSKKIDTNNIVKEEKTPVQHLLISQKKKETEKLNICLDIKIPKKELIEILRSSYGDEIENDIYEYINNQLDQNDIRQIIKKNIEKFIKTYYVSK